MKFIDLLKTEKDFWKEIFPNGRPIKLTLDELRGFAKVVYPKHYRYTSTTNKRKFFNAQKYRWNLGKKCHLCKSKNFIHQHHIIPLSQGGPNIKMNIIALCEYHHSQVHLRDVRTYENTPLTFIPETVLKKEKVKVILRKKVRGF